MTSRGYLAFTSGGGSLTACLPAWAVRKHATFARWLPATTPGLRVRWHNATAHGLSRSMAPVQTIHNSRFRAMHHRVVVNHIEYLFLRVRLHHITIGAGTDCPLNTVDGVICCNQNNMLAIPCFFELFHQFVAVSIR